MGPARNSSAERLELSWKQARGSFARDYNDRLFTGLLVAGVAAIVVFRFLIRVPLLEGAGWISVIFLEVYPHVTGGSGGMYATRWWKWTAAAWEAFMLLLFGAGGLMVWVALVGALLLWWRRQRRRRQKKAVLVRHGDIRDLDV